MSFVLFGTIFSWFGQTAAPLVGPLGFIVVLGPALFEAPYFALTGAGAALAWRLVPRPLAPLAAAAAFIACEWLRSIGLLGVPFGQLGYTQIGTPLAGLAAFAGVYGVGFVIAVAGAYLGGALLDRTLVRPALIALAGCAAASAAAWLAWPARTAPLTATIPVAAVQADVKQSVKWHPDELPRGVNAHVALTQAVTGHPQLVVWPETVVATILSADPGLQAKFSALARAERTTLVVGSIERDQTGFYNALWVYGPGGELEAIYRKRQLVPFAEFLPWRDVLGHVPLANLISNFSAGTAAQVVAAGPLRIAPMICWESGFPDLAFDQVRAGANAIVIATDDAWFDGTAGPDQHLKMAQMRAIETGMWTVQAAPTGITAIVAPNGALMAQAPQDVATVLEARIGLPVPTVFDRIGPTAVALSAVGLYALLLAAGVWRRRRA